MTARMLLIAAMFSTGLSGCTNSYAVIATDELCRDWRHQTVSKDDRITQGTAEQIEANNLSRPAWGCRLGENRAG